LSCVVVVVTSDHIIDSQSEIKREKCISLS